MPRKKVALGGLLAFGAGVAVGASWPRAGNLVGYLLQRLGFELTDLTLWIWDPEKSLDPAPQRVLRRKVKKKVRALQLAEGASLPAKRRGSAKKRTPSTRIHSATGVLSATGQTRAHLPEQGNLNSPSDQSTKNGPRVFPAKRSAPSSLASEADRRPLRRGRRKAQRTAAKASRKNPTLAGRAGKGSVFPRTVSSAVAALN
jgi:hypothetical protein